MNFHHPLIIREQKNAFFIQDEQEDVLIEQIETIEQQSVHYLEMTAQLLLRPD